MCKKIQVKIYPKNWSDLVIDYLDSSPLYRKVTQSMKKWCTVMTKAGVIKKNEEIFKKLVEENKKLPTRPERQAVSE